MKANYSCRRRVFLGLAVVAAGLFLAGFGYGYVTPDLAKFHAGPDPSLLANLDCT